LKFRVVECDFIASGKNSLQNAARSVMRVWGRRHNNCSEIFAELDAT